MGVGRTAGAHTPPCSSWANSRTYRRTVLLWQTRGKTRMTSGFLSLCLPSPPPSSPLSSLQHSPSLSDCYCCLTHELCLYCFSPPPPPLAYNPPLSSEWTAPPSISLVFRPLTKGQVDSCKELEMNHTGSHLVTRGRGISTRLSLLCHCLVHCLPQLDAFGLPHQTPATLGRPSTLRPSSLR